MAGNANFQNPDPYMWLASAGEFSADDVFGPPGNVLEATYAGYPGASGAEVAQRTFANGTGGGPFWTQAEWHSLFWLGLGGFLIYKFTQE